MIKREKTTNKSVHLVIKYLKLQKEIKRREKIRKRLALETKKLASQRLEFQKQMKLKELKKREKIRTELLITNRKLAIEHKKLKEEMNKREKIRILLEATAKKLATKHLRLQEEMKDREKIRILLQETDRKLAMKHLELQRVSQYKSQFISTVSHELRTPLSIISEAVSLILEEIPGKINKKQTEILDTALRNLKRLSNLINDLLDISKIESGRIQLQKTNVNIVKLIRDVGINWEAGAREKGLKVNYILPDYSIKIMIDQGKIEQVINNLLSNAVKFTPSGGRITIKLVDFEKRIEISVSDTGIGFSKNNISKVFQKFVQFEREEGPGPKGTGLGLSICKELVLLHKGKISLFSKEGVGSTFTFWLPK